MRQRTRIGLLALIVGLCSQGAPLAADTEALIGTKAVAFVTYDEVKTALSKAGVGNVRDETADPNFPTFGGDYSDGTGLQATLYACDTAKQRCRGVELLSVIPATSLRNAQIIVGSIERTTFDTDAQVFNLPDGPDSFAVMLSTYLVYDYGVSDQLLPVSLDHFTKVVDETKGFMLKDDPAHAALWSKKN